MRSNDWIPHQISETLKNVKLFSGKKLELSEKAPKVYVTLLKLHGECSGVVIKQMLDLPVNKEYT